MRVCLDTSAYSHFKRGHARAAEVIDRASDIGVPAIVLGELAVGFRLGRRRVENERELATFLAHPVVALLEVDDEVAGIYADIVVDLRRAGTPVPANDIWIAATAARWGAPVLTYDAHFQAIARVGTVLLTEPA
ncbi:MAG: type II toxin-antitoxin system VapC family toxin [Vicinamibacterales bacterium]